MKLHHLLQHRASLLRQTRLANAAFAYQELGEFEKRIARGQLRGQVTLHLADPAADLAWPTLIADEGSQSVIEEHFVDHDLLDLADLLVFVDGDARRKSFTFRLEELGSRFRPALRQELERAGVELPASTEVANEPNRE